MLYTALHLLGISIPEVPAQDVDGKPIRTKAYNPVSKHHPCVLWLLGGFSHFTWVLNMALELCTMYSQKTGKTHACQYHLEHIKRSVTIQDYPPDVPNPLEWSDRLFDLEIPERIVRNCMDRVVRENAPHMCSFGVACIDTDEKNTGCSPDKVKSRDLVEAYKKYYIFKAAHKFHMTWDGKGGLFGIPDELLPTYQDWSGVWLLEKDGPKSKKRKRDVANL